MIFVDFSHMSPAPDGAFRGGLTGQPNYIGGRLDGRLAPAEFQPFRRSSSGQPIEDGQPIPPEHYVLFAVDGGYLFHYIHCSILPAGYHDPPAAE